jgi:hypothetical protein
MWMVSHDEIVSRSISHRTGQEARDGVGVFRGTLSELMPGTNAIAFNSSLC